MQTFVKPCRHGSFLLIRGDLVSTHSDIYGEWSETEVELFRAILPPDGVCVEVGSNIGMHAVPLSQICPQGAVYCYEPQRPIFHVLCANLAMNNRLNVVARRLGVGAENARISLQVSDYEQPWNYGSFSLTEGFSSEGNFGGQVKHEEVDVVALDHDPELANLARLDLLKIDAEGMEIAVLRGARGQIARHRPDIFVEANHADQARAVMDELGADYAAYWFWVSRFRPNNFNRVGLPTPGEDRNLILRHRSRDCSLFEATLKPASRDFGDSDAIPVLVQFG